MFGKIRILLVIGLCFLGTVASSPAQTFKDADKLLDYLKNDEVAAALELVRREKPAAPDSGQVQEAENVLVQADRYQKNTTERIVLRGDAARIFGFYAESLVFYQTALDRLEDHFQKNGYRITDFYIIAAKGAASAFWIKDYDRAFALFGYIEANGTTWVKEMGQNKAALLRGYLDGAKTAGDRIKFAEKFWRGFPKLPFYAVDVRKFLEETLRINPTAAERKQIYGLIRTTAAENNDTETAENYLKKLIAEFPADDSVPEAVFTTAQFYFKRSEYEDARKWLNWIVENEKTTGRYVPLAYLGLAEVCEKSGDEAAMVKFLKLAARAPQAAPTNRGIMDTSDSRQTALVRLGKYHQSKAQYGEALKYFSEWQPASWCGTCSAQIKYERDLYISECLAALGRDNEALDQYILPLLKIDGGALYSDARIPRLAVSIYEKRNALEEFLAMIKPHAENRYNRTAQIAEKLALIKILAKKRDIQQLVSEIKHNDGYVANIAADFIRDNNWQSVAVAEELAAMNGAEFPFLKARYEAILASPNRKAQNDGVWVIYALGVSKAPESEEYLKELLTEAKSGTGRPIATRAVEFALSLKSGDGLKGRLK